MAFKTLLEAFAGEEDLPVDLKAIKAWIVSQGIQDEIEFIGVDIDEEVLRGFLHRFRETPRPYAEPTWHAHIYYERRQSVDWINMVTCKEMVHLMDGTAGMTKKEDFDTLIERLSLPLEMKVVLEDPSFALVDKVGDLYAAALLLPLAARDALMPAYRAGDLTFWDIAKLAVMPPKYARLVMSDSWEKAYASLMKT